MVPRRPLPAALLALALALPFAGMLAVRALRVGPGDPADGGLGLRTNLARVGALALYELDGPRPSPCDGPLAALAARWRAAVPGLVTTLAPRSDGRAAEVLVAGLGHPRVAELCAVARVPYEHRPNAPGGPVVALAGELYAAGDFAFALTMLDPRQPTLPLVLVAGAAESCARALEVLAPSAAPELIVWSRGERVLAVPLSIDGGPRWSEVQVFPPTERDAAADERARAAVTEGLAALRARLAAWFPGSGPRPLPEVRGHTTVEALQRDGALDSAARFDRHHGVLDVLQLAGRPFDAWAALAEGWLASDLGPAAEAWLAEGAAAAAAAGVGGAALDDLAAVAVQSDPATWGIADEVQRLAQLGALERRTRAGLVFQSLAAALAPPRLEAVWRGGLAVLQPVELEQVAAAFAAAREQVGQRSSARAVRALPERFTGVTLAAPARPDPAGLGTRAAEESLARLAELGARVVLVPASIVAPRDGAPRSLAGDMALAVTVQALARRGVSVVLAVEALTGEHGAGPADTPQLVTVERWQAAEERLAAAVRHGAWLARTAGADVLVLARDAAPLHAVALGGDAPEPAWYTPLRAAKEQAWQRLVQEARAAGTPLAVIAPGPGSSSPVRAELAFLAVDLELDLGLGGAPPPRDARALAARLGVLLAPAGEAALVGFAGTSAAYRGTPRGATDGAAQVALLGALADALTAPAAPPRVFLRHWRLAGSAAPRSEDVAHLAGDARGAALLRRLFGRE